MRHDTLVKAARTSGVGKGYFWARAAGGATVELPEMANPFAGEGEDDLAGAWTIGFNIASHAVAICEQQGFLLALKHSDIGICPYYDTTFAKAYKRGFASASKRLALMPAAAPVNYETLPQYAYLIELDGRWKIGITGGPQKRINGLTNSAGIEARYLRLYRVRPSSAVRSLEGALHSHFQERWLRAEFFTRIEPGEFDDAAAAISAERGYSLELVAKMPSAAQSGPPWLWGTRGKKGRR